MTLETQRYRSLIRLNENSVRFTLVDSKISANVEAIGRLSGIDYVEIEHGVYSDDASNLIQLSMKHRQLKEIVHSLAIHGFHAFAATGTMTKFVSQHEIGNLWHKVRAGEYTQSPDGVVHTLEYDRDHRVEALLVVFSSMADTYNKSSLMRFFEQNFKSVNKHVPERVAVLRIADIGGVVGGFYMSTTFDPEAGSKVQNLIASTMRKLDIAPERTVLYGASKGGTGALYHALRGKLHCVAVDPVVHDSYYESRYQDSHWTGGLLFPQSKQDAFTDLAAALTSEHRTIAIVTSPGSPLWDSISDFSNKIPEEKLRLIVSYDPKITDHPHVSQQTLKTVTGLINVGLAGLDVGGGLTKI